MGAGDDDWTFSAAYTAIGEGSSERPRAESSAAASAAASMVLPPPNTAGSAPRAAAAGAPASPPFSPCLPRFRPLPARLRPPEDLRGTAAGPSARSNTGTRADPPCASACPRPSAAAAAAPLLPTSVGLTTLPPFSVLRRGSCGNCSNAGRAGRPAGRSAGMDAWRVSESVAGYCLAAGGSGASGIEGAVGCVAGEAADVDGEMELAPVPVPAPRSCIAERRGLSLCTAAAAAAASTANVGLGGRPGASASTAAVGLGGRPAGVGATLLPTPTPTSSLFSLPPNRLCGIDGTADAALAARAADERMLSSLATCHGETQKAQRISSTSSLLQGTIDAEPTLRVIVCRPCLCPCPCPCPCARSLSLSRAPNSAPSDFFVRRRGAGADVGPELGKTTALAPVPCAWTCVLTFARRARLSDTSCPSRPAPANDDDDDDAAAAAVADAVIELGRASAPRCCTCMLLFAGMAFTCERLIRWGGCEAQGR